MHMEKVHSVVLILVNKLELGISPQMHFYHFLVLVWPSPSLVHLYQCRAVSPAAFALSTPLFVVAASRANSRVTPVKDRKHAQCRATFPWGSHARAGSAPFAQSRDTIATTTDSTLGVFEKRVMRSR